MLLCIDSNISLNGGNTLIIENGKANCLKRLKNGHSIYEDTSATITRKCDTNDKGTVKCWEEKVIREIYLNVGEQIIWLWQDVK